jgi:hypothetical protein
VEVRIMTLGYITGVSVESWVELKEQVETRVEVDLLNDCATLYFGSREEFVLHLGRENLREVADLADRAHAELVAAETAALGEETGCDTR